jgi:hypothetical protein
MHKINKHKIKIQKKEQLDCIRMVLVYWIFMQLLKFEVCYKTFVHITIFLSYRLSREEINANFTYEKVNET